MSLQQTLSPAAIGRRDFLRGLVAAALGGGQLCASASMASLPTIRLGPYRVTRLIAGHNPIAGYSYLGHHMDQHMREYFTVERIVEFIHSCESNGINTFQFSWLEKTVQALRLARDRGSRIQTICLLRDPPEIRQAVDAVRPIAVAHHGGATDTLFAQGKAQRVRDFVKEAHDRGVLAGISAHNPACIRQIAEEEWEVDFLMTCFYFLTRQGVAGNTMPAVSTVEIEYPFLREDPPAMAKVIRQVRRPCLAFKILAAGRMCHTQQQVREAFRFAFENIKRTDGVIVGMYPRFFDEIAANAAYTRELAS